MATPNKAVVKKRVDFRRALSDQVASAIEENGTVPWDRMSGAMRPFNPISGTQFKGGNFVKLLHEGLALGTDDPRWMTFKQAVNAGFRVRAGSVGRQIEFWDFGADKHDSKVDENDQKSAGDDNREKAEPAVKRGHRPFYVTLFHASDIIDLPPLKRDASWRAKDAVQQLVAANTDHYLSKGTRLVVPPRSRQIGDEEYCCDVLHAIAMHAVKATSGGEPGEHAAAKVRLRAEIVAQHLYGAIGVKPKAARSNAEMAAVAVVVKADKHELFRAAKESDSVAEHILSLVPELKKQLDARFENNRTKEAPKRPNTIIGQLPHFGPARAPMVPPVVSSVAPQANDTGLGDPRWPQFQAMVTREGEKYGIPAETVGKTLVVIVPDFTAVMNAAERNGYTIDELQEMFVERLIADMRVNNEREQNWNKLCDQVRVAAVGVLSAEEIEHGLRELSSRYMGVLAESRDKEWDDEKTDAKVREVIFGPKGRRPITPEFVREQFAAGVVSAHAEEEDDFVLTPTSGGLQLDPEEDLLTPFGSGLVVEDAFVGSQDRGDGPDGP